MCVCDRRNALRECSVLLFQWQLNWGGVFTNRHSSFPANTTHGAGENLRMVETPTGTCEEVYRSPWSWSEGQLSLLYHLEEAGSDSSWPANGRCWSAQHLPIRIGSWVFKDHTDLFLTLIALWLLLEPLHLLWAPGHYETSPRCSILSFLINLCEPQSSAETAAQHPEVPV